MNLLLLGIGMLVAISTTLAMLWSVLRRLSGAPWPMFGRFVLFQVALLPVHAFILFPLLLGLLGSRIVSTRHDERAWRGPIIENDGSWRLQSRESLAAGAPDPRGVTRWDLLTSDGVRLRAFHVAPVVRTHPVVVVMVHGLFRGGLELETPGSILRDLGCDVVLLELRNHGGSARAAATFGRTEEEDVLAAVARVRAEPEFLDFHIVLYGISLGTVAVMRAAARMEELGGLVLDAPVVDPAVTADRMLSARRDGRQRALGLPQPFRSLSLHSLQWWSGFSFREIDPLGALSARVAMAQSRGPFASLVIHGVQDDRVSVSDARLAFDTLPGDEEWKELWLVETAGHGDAFERDGDGYRTHLSRLLSRVVR